MRTDAPDEIALGTQVTIRRGGATTSYRIVGGDEADSPKGMLSWNSPLTGALMGARAGEAVESADGRPAGMVESIECG